MNTLYYGDNLDILREFIPDESVDLIYLDPPFNSKRAYNVIFKDKEGKYPPSQIEAFDDTWKWCDETEEAMWELSKSPYPPELFRMIESFRNFMGTSDMTAYLVMMTIRLWELRRVLKKTGSIYLHCDPTASHYLKIVMDRIWGVKNFRNEIIWKRTSAHSDKKGCGSTHDIILYYSRANDFTWNKQYQEYDEKYIKTNYSHIDSNGRRFMADNLSASGLSGGGYEYEWNGVVRIWRLKKERMEELERENRIYYTKNGLARYKRYLDEMPGIPIQDIWTDISAISSHAKERLGYPTQKPLALLERIIKSSSNEGDIVLDPFCGCGTTVTAAEKLSRKWIGVDITVLAINLIEKRLNDHFPDVLYEIKGIPNSVASAKKMASTRTGKFNFERWFITTLGGRPFKSTGGGDTGIDGFMFFSDINNKPHSIIISVKGGGYGPGAIRDLKGVIERENAEMGLLLALESPSKQTIAEAASAGRYQMPEVKRTYPKIQIFTVEDFFNGICPELPDISETYKKAKRIKREKEKQPELI